MNEIEARVAELLATCEPMTDEQRLVAVRILARPNDKRQNAA